MRCFFYTRLIIFLLFINVWIAQPVAADTRYIIRGIEGEVLTNVEAFMPIFPEAKAIAKKSFQIKLKSQLQQALQALGYYSASIDISIEPTTAEPILSVLIIAGNRVQVQHFDWQILGEGKNEPDIKGVFSASALKLNSPLHHGLYEQLKQNLLDQGLSLGYLDAKFSQAQVEVNPSELSAKIILQLDTGIRYKFGNIQFSPTPFDQELIDRLTHIVKEDYYSNEKLNRFYQDLINTQYFQSVTIKPLLDQRRNGYVPLQVELLARAQNVLSVGAGVSTDIGARLRLGWDKPWVNQYGHSLESDFEISNIRNSATASYRIPLEKPLEEAYVVQMGWQDISFDDVTSKKWTSSLKRQWLLDDSWTQSIFIRWDREVSTLGDLPITTDMYIPGGNWTRLRRQSKGEANWGDRQTYSVEFSSRDWGSESDFARLRVQHRWLRTYRDKHRLFLRSDLGAIIVNDIDDIPASLRFFAGGDQSIRGFDFNSIGAVDESNVVIGGRYLAVAGIEYAYQFHHNWRLALFVDAGSAFDDTADIKVGTGFGLHRITPVGTIRIDVGVGVSEPDKPVRLHLSFGIQL